MSTRLVSYERGDLVEYKASFRAPWRPGFVAAVERHQVTIEDGYSRRLCVIQLGKKGKLRALSGMKLVDTVSHLQRHQAAQRLPQIAPVLVRTGGAPKKVPRPAPPQRSGRYLAYVRAQPCASCAAPGPSEAHHAGRRGVGEKADDFGTVPLCRRCHQAVTDNGAVPARSRAETETLILQHQVQLLIGWAGGAAGAAAA